MKTAMRVIVTLLLIVSAPSAFLLASLNDRYLPPPFLQISHAVEAQTMLVVDRAFRVVHGMAETPTPTATSSPKGTPSPAPVHTPTESPTATAEVPILPTMVIPEGTLKAPTATPTSGPVPTDTPISGRITN